jgi:S1-C subfamily serine protease
MKAFLRSQLLAGVLGALVVAGGFLALGVTGRRTTRTIVEESPVAAQPASNSTTSSLTPHAIYERDAPGVVFVRAQVVQQVQTPFDLFPQRQQSSSTGSGFLIRRSGLVLTNYHVIEGADRSAGVTVRFQDSVTRPATVIGEDQNSDLAILRVDMTGVPPVAPLPMGDSTSVRVGDPTLAIGNPFGLDRTLTTGIVSALQRQIQAPNGFVIDNVIQTDAPLNLGNSGGPLLDAAGRVIGINSQIETASGSGSVGIGFAIPIDTAKQFLPRLSAGRAVTLAYLGVTGTGTDEGGSPGGVNVQVDQGGPAADAGLRSHDVIKSIDGRPANSVRELQALVDSSRPGQEVVVRIRRGGVTRAVDVVLGSRPVQASQ